MEKLTADDIRDVAIRITDKLVELGYVPDCIDTDDEDEFIVQDIIFYQIISALKQVSSRTPIDTEYVMSLLENYDGEGCVTDDLLGYMRINLQRGGKA
jgi:hypothetical protein